MLPNRAPVGTHTPPQTTPLHAGGAHDCQMDRVKDTHPELPDEETNNLLGFGFGFFQVSHSGAVGFCYTISNPQFPKCGVKYPASP